jgi:hypothetical protein
VDNLLATSGDFFEFDFIAHGQLFAMSYVNKLIHEKNFIFNFNNFIYRRFGLRLG